MSVRYRYTGEGSIKVEDKYIIPNTEEGLIFANQIPEIERFVGNGLITREHFMPPDFVAPKIDEVDTSLSTEEIIDNATKKSEDDKDDNEDSVDEDDEDEDEDDADGNVDIDVDNVDNNEDDKDDNEDSVDEDDEDEDDEDEDEDDEDETVSIVDLKKMTITQLRDLATLNEIDLGSEKIKKKIIKIVMRELEDE